MTRNLRWIMKRSSSVAFLALCAAAFSLPSDRLAGQDKKTRKKGREAWYTAIAFDPDTGLHYRGQGAEKTTAEKNALALLIELGGKNPSVLATTAQNEWAAIAIGKDKLGRRMAGVATGQPTADRARELARQDYVNKQGTGNSTTTSYLLNKPLKANVIHVAVVFNSGSGAWAYGYSGERAVAEKFAIDHCEKNGAQQPKVIATTTKSGFFAIARSRKASLWVYGVGLGLPRAAQAKAAALAACIKNGGSEAALCGVWEVNARPNWEFLIPLQKK